MNAQIHSINDYLDDDDLLLVPEGEYELMYQNHATWLFNGKAPKLVIGFRILNFGEHHNKLIHSYYNVDKLIGKPRRNGRFKAGWRSNIMFDYATLFGKPARKDRIALSRLGEQIVLGNARTVTKNREQKNYPESLRYSLIDNLTGVKQI